jgi:hypothetical protein
MLEDYYETAECSTTIRRENNTPTNRLKDYESRLNDELSLADVKKKKKSKIVLTRKRKSNPLM